MPAKRVHLVASFGPEVMQALLRGAREEFTVGPLPYRQAIQFMQRLNKLRQAMMNENHVQYPIVARTKITVVWGEKAGLPPVEEKLSSRNVPSPRDINVLAKLIIRPHDSEFNKVLIDSGIDAASLKEDPIDGLVPRDDPSGVDFLGQVLAESNKKPPGV